MEIDITQEIIKAERFEFTATGYGFSATGFTEDDAELNLLRKVVKKLTSNAYIELEVIR